MTVNYPAQTRWILENCFAGDSMRLSYILGEACECAEAIVEGKYLEALEELKQVWLYSLLMLYQFTGISLPAWGTKTIIEEDFSRFQVWGEIFAIYEVDFSLSYFSNGNNWRRPHKVVAALASAGVAITISEAETILKKLNK